MYGVAISSSSVKRHSASMLATYVFSPLKTPISADGRRRTRFENRLPMSSVVPSTRCPSPFKSIPVRTPNPKSPIRVPPPDAPLLGGENCWAVSDPAATAPRNMVVRKRIPCLPLAVRRDPRGGPSVIPRCVHRDGGGGPRERPHQRRTRGVGHERQDLRDRHGLAAGPRGQRHWTVQQPRAEESQHRQNVAQQHADQLVPRQGAAAGDREERGGREDLDVVRA